MEHHSSPVPGVVEKRTIDAVPATERHGRTRDLFTIWFSANLGPLTVVTGALAPTAFGLSFRWSLAALLVGHLGGGFLMALHSAQGPQLGVPQMIQSRGQFGSVGALAVVLVVIVMYQGFFASNLVVGAQSLSEVTPVGQHTGVLLGAVVSLVVAVVGYRLMHRIGALTSWVFGAVQLVGAVWLFVGGLPEGFLTRGGFSIGGFLGVVSVGALWQIAYAPYVSDYSRYMPADRAGVRSTLWCTYAGCVLGSLLPMVVGAAIGLAGGDNPIAALDGLLGNTLGQLTLWSFALVTMLTNSMNLYGAVLCAVTAVQTFAHRWLPRATGRAVLGTLLTVLSVFLALKLAGSFMSSYLDLIYVLQYVLIPWTAINLVDFYLIRHGDYDIASFFARDGGIYGRWNPTALGVYALGILAEIPFMAQSLYTGPVAHALGDTDLGWIAGLVVTVPVYLLAARLTSRRRRPAAGTESPGTESADAAGDESPDTTTPPASPAPTSGAPTV
ncbi:cytosine permease [Streptomyces sp. NBC_01306]|uniref:purine-cytosine permease family protein n=1 Tax=Streptomyces sp. NBC_01306 TaxID=2903819 RepID=UPI002258AB63|nr:cytosine permease [Streptomyces sp. NBC_01306]MCX4723145.1 cytosine permease [Streptomyces sp. NBC_01306]